MRPTVAEWFTLEQLAKSSTAKFDPNKVSWSLLPASKRLYTTDEVVTYVRYSSKSAQPPFVYAVICDPGNEEPLWYYLQEQKALEQIRAILGDKDVDSGRIPYSVYSGRSKDTDYYVVRMGVDPSVKWEEHFEEMTRQMRLNNML